MINEICNTDDILKQDYTVLDFDGETYYARF